MFETGAETHEVNNLILWADNVYELSKIRDKEYSSGKLNFTYFLKETLNDFNKNVDEEEKIQLTNDQEKNFCNIYKNDYKNWLIDHPQFKELEKVEDVLNLCKISDNLILLPPNKLNRDLYLEVKKKFELIGGKWNTSKQGFLFKENPSEYLQKLKEGKNINLKKEFQFFGTPDDLADYLVELAEIDNEDEILEPSAGQGSIIKAIHRDTWEARTVWAFELMPLNQTFLNKIIGCRLLGSDFLTENETHFDKIIANPPFNKNQDIDHIYKMYDSLKDNGRLVSIASKHWKISNNKKEKQFQEWLADKNAQIIDIEKGRFKESGTMVAMCIIVIDK